MHIRIHIPERHIKKASEWEDFITDVYFRKRINSTVQLTFKTYRIIRSKILWHFFIITEFIFSKVIAYEYNLF